MRNARIPVFWCMALFVFAAGLPALCHGSDSQRVLARVEVPGTLEELDLPVHAAIVDGEGVFYALVIATPETLQASGAPFSVLDECPPGTGYLLAGNKKSAERERAALRFGAVLDDGRRLVVRYDKQTGAALLRSGFRLKLMSDTPIATSAPAGSADRCRAAERSSVSALAGVTEMLGQVTEATFRSYISGLSGASAVTVSGSPYTFLTRNTESGTPIQKATQYVYEQLAAMPGMTASLHSWSSGGYSGRNVVGELRGADKPDEIVIFLAHLDSINEAALTAAVAPGADDDASGCSALLTAAGIMSGRSFQRTIRFVFATGEEQGLLGSAAYAGSVRSQNIVGVVNLDMIAFNTPGTAPTQRLKIRTSQNSGYAADLAIANTFKSVVSAYGLGGSLQVVISADGEPDSDQASFWDEGIPAIWVIEDDINDFDDLYYHTKNDTLQTLDTAYGTAQVKASLGTVAHLAGLSGAAPTTTSVAGTTTTVPSGASTTTVPWHASTTSTARTDHQEGPCPAEEVLGPDSGQLENLRALRDTGLARSAAGRRIVSIYYRNMRSIQKALDGSPAMQSAARWVLETIAGLSSSGR